MFASAGSAPEKWVKRVGSTRANDSVDTRALQHFLGHRNWPANCIKRLIAANLSSGPWGLSMYFLIPLYFLR
jgi:hypothetical protein